MGGWQPFNLLNNHVSVQFIPVCSKKGEKRERTLITNSLFLPTILFSILPNLYSWRGKCLLFNVKRRRLHLTLRKDWFERKENSPWPNDSWLVITTEPPSCLRGLVPWSCNPRSLTSRISFSFGSGDWCHGHSHSWLLPWGPWLPSWKGLSWCSGTVWALSLTREVNSKIEIWCPWLERPDQPCYQVPRTGQKLFTECLARG